MLIFMALFQSLPLMDTSIFLTIVDDYSRFTWILFLKNKTEVRPLLQNFLTLTES